MLVKTKAVGEQRAEMMQQWGDYLETCTSGKVLPFQRRTA